MFFNSLDNLPLNTVIDTNVLLDAAFVNGLSRKAILSLNGLGFSPIIDSKILDEAKKILRRCTLSLALSYDPLPIMDVFISRAKISIFPASLITPAPGINKSDKHVAYCAIENGAWILSGDSPLAVELKKIEIEARFPWDVLAYYGGKNNLEGVEWIVRSIRPTKYGGTIFAQFIPSGWGSGIPELFPICDIDKVGWLYYDGTSSEWVLSLISGAEQRLKAHIERDTLQKVAATYQFYQETKKGKLRLAALDGGKFKCQACPSNQPFIKDIPEQVNISIGSARGHSINGYLQNIVIGPQVSDTDTLKSIFSILNGAPNPFDANMLRPFLKNADVQHRMHGVGALYTAFGIL